MDLFISEEASKLFRLKLKIRRIAQKTIKAEHKNSGNR